MAPRDQGISYPPEDSSDFHDAHFGQIYSMPNCVIESATGEVVWDNEAYRFITGDDVPDTVNRSLWRQSKLCRIQGLFQIAEKVFQVRNAPTILFAYL